jgi:adenylate cyclase
MAATEIERKYLVPTLPARLGRFRHRAIAQGYIVPASPHGQVRLRRKGPRYFLTVKRAGGSEHGREETEVPITRAQWKALWPLTKGRRLAKVRYDIRWREHKIELDVFRGRHKGLAVAEVEFPSEAAARSFEPPAWFGREVTHSPRYKNSRLAAQGAAKKRG